MSDYVLTNHILASVRSHAGVPNMPNEAVELVWPEAEKSAKQRGIAIEFIAAELVKATYAQAFQEARRNGKARDFETYCKSKLSDKEPIWNKLFARKSKVQQAVAEAQQLEAEITDTKAALRAAEQRVCELINSIAATEGEREDHSQEAVEASVMEAAKIWHLRHKSPHNSSIIDTAVAHVTDSEAVLRILNARLVWLRDSLSKDNSKVDGLRKSLKDLERSL